MVRCREDRVKCFVCGKGGHCVAQCTMVTLEMSKHAKNDNGPLQVEHAEMDI